MLHHQLLVALAVAEVQAPMQAREPGQQDSAVKAAQAATELAQSRPAVAVVVALRQSVATQLPSAPIQVTVVLVALEFLTLTRDQRSLMVAAVGVLGVQYPVQVVLVVLAAAVQAIQRGQPVAEP